MPANNDYPVTDGIAPSWADVKVSLTPDGAALIDMKDIAAISSGATVETGEQRAGGRVIRRTTGSVSNEASITLYLRGLHVLLRGLSASMPSRGAAKLIRFAHFNVTYQFTPEGSDEIFERRLRGCFVSGNTISAAEGTDATQVEIPLNPVEIVDVVDGQEYALL